MRILKRLSIIIVVVILLHLVGISLSGLLSHPQKSDLMVVLGNKVELNGSPSSRLQERLDEAIDLYESGYSRYILLSGGIGKEGFDESRVMADYLEGKGIPSQVLIRDSIGINTQATALNSLYVLEDRGFSSVIVVSHWYHIPRCKLAFRNEGIQNVSGAPANKFRIRDFYSLFREVVGFYVYMLRG